MSTAPQPRPSWARSATLKRERPPVKTPSAAHNLTPAQLAKLPVSAFAPLALARLLSVFGPSFEVHLSAACTVSPDTLLRVVLDISLQSFLRHKEPGHLQSLKILLYAGAGKHKLSQTTKDVVKGKLKLLGAAEAIHAALEGLEPPPAPLASNWNLLLKGMNGNGDRLVEEIATNLAAWDEQALQIRTLKQAGNQAQAANQTLALLGEGLPAWKKLNPGLLQAPQALLLVESSLQTLARLMCGIDQPSADLPSRESTVTQLLEPGRRPLGHWLHQVMQASNSTNLVVFAQHLLRVEARHLNRVISHDLLKKWSSSKNIAMPQTALEPVLRGVAIRDRAERLVDRYYLARFLSFLCDLTWASIPGGTPSWPDIQAQMTTRYIAVHRLEVAQQMARSCGA